jgi:hypothetical protein
MTASVIADRMLLVFACLLAEGVGSDERRFSSEVAMKSHVHPWESVPTSGTRSVKHEQQEMRSEKRLQRLIRFSAGLRTIKVAAEPA